MSKLLYKIEKKELEDGINIKLNYSKSNSNLDKILIEDKIKYSIFIKEDDFKKLNLKSENIIINKEKYKNYEGDYILKIEINNKELYSFIIEESKNKNFQLFELDFPKEHRYLIDNDIKILYIKDKKAENKKNSLKYISIDIETIGNKENQEIIMISSYSPFDINQSIVYLNKEKIDKNNLDKIKDKIKNKKRIEKEGKKTEKIKKEGEKRKEEENKFEIIILENEKELLEKFKKNIIDFNPHLIIGWNLIDFDFKVIRDKMKEYGISFNFSNSKENCILKLNSNFFRDSSMNCQSILIFDIIQILKSNYINFQDYKLDTVAKEILKDNKISLETDEIEEENGMENKLKLIENMFYNDILKLIEYNFKDSLLVSKITEKLGLIELMIKRSIITNTPLSRVKSPIATLDIMYLKELHKRKLVAKTNFNFSDSNQIQGAYVIEPKPNYYKDIFVFDFKSLYPSIIMTFNIDPFTISNNGDIIAPNGAKFIRKKGILPEIIEKIYKERDIAKKEKDDIKSYALKITMNSFYGAMASPKSRFHNRDVGGAITAFGREILLKAKEFVERRGNIVIYGDTDSIFVKVLGLENNDKKNKIKIGLELEKELNRFFDKWIEEKFKVKSFLKIEFEKLFSQFFIPSKKRYVGFNEISNKIEFVGLESVRGDWTELAREFQRELVDIIFNRNKSNLNDLEINKKLKEFILNKIKDLKSRKYDDKLIYTKKITKPLSEYTKTTPPHVKAARELNNFDGRIVKYVMIKTGPKHIRIINEMKKNGKKIDYDYEHYIEKQLKGVAEDLLKYRNLDFNEIIYSNKQKSLNSFFN